MACLQSVTVVDKLAHQENDNLSVLLCYTVLDWGQYLLNKYINIQRVKSTAQWMFVFSFCEV